jgi:polyhydroxyalkanoate synthesis regulator phasin
MTALQVQREVTLLRREVDLIDAAIERGEIDREPGRRQIADLAARIEAIRDRLLATGG